MPLESDKYACSLETIPLQDAIVYGPLDSRRFGSSLGINVLPTDQKVCSYNCVYCQYRDTERHEACEFPKVAAVEEALDGYLAARGPAAKKIDWITFSGNGEPTLHPSFPAIVDRVLAVRNKRLPGVPVGILSNSSTCYLPEVQAALMKLDGRFMKLDAGNIRTFRAVNRPGSSMMWGDVICGLYHLPKTTLQSLFVAGKADNTGDEAVADWILAVNYIRPLSVQIYTTERPAQDNDIHPVPHERLEAIARRLTVSTRVPASVY